MSDNGNNNSNNSNRGHGNGPRIAPMLVAILVVLLIISYLTRAVSSATNKEIPYTDFIAMLDEGKVASVYLAADKIIAYRDTIVEK